MEELAEVVRKAEGGNRGRSGSCKGSPLTAGSVSIAFLLLFSKRLELSLMLVPVPLAPAFHSTGIFLFMIADLVHAGP